VHNSRICGETAIGGAPKFRGATAKGGAPKFRGETAIGGAPKFRGATAKGGAPKFRGATAKGGAPKFRLVGLSLGVLAVACVREPAPREIPMPAYAPPLTQQSCPHGTVRAKDDAGLRCEGHGFVVYPIEADEPDASVPASTVPLPADWANGIQWCDNIASMRRTTGPGRCRRALDEDFRALEVNAALRFRTPAGREALSDECREHFIRSRRWCVSD
jgi:hypothetical protein